MKFNTKYASDYTHYMNNNTDIKLTDNIYKQRECYFSWANKYAITADWDVSVAYDFQWNGYEGFDLNKDHDKEHPMNTATRGTHYISAATAFTVADRLKVQASVLETFVNEEKRQRDKAPNKSKGDPGAVPLLPTVEETRHSGEGLLQDGLPHADIQRPLLHGHG